MSKFSRTQVMTFLPIAVAVVIMAISGYAQGVWSERWMTFPELDLYAEQLNAIPETIGQWQGTDLGQSDEKVKKISGAVGELMRTYRNPAGEEVRVSIICARQRDIFYHTPERCYPAAGFDMQGEPQQEVLEIGNTTAEFFTTSFLKSEPTGTHAERGLLELDGRRQVDRPPQSEARIRRPPGAIQVVRVRHDPAGQQGQADDRFLRATSFASSCRPPSRP